MDLLNNAGTATKTDYSRAQLASIILWVLLCCLSLCVYATDAIIEDELNHNRHHDIPVVDTASPSEIIRNFIVWHFVDSSQSLKVSAIQQNLLSAKPSESEFVYPFHSANHWFVFKVTNSSPVTVKRYLWLDVPYIDSVDLYQEKDGKWLSDLNGATRPIQRRQTPALLPSFELTIEPNEELTLYVKCHFSSFVVKQSMSIASEDLYHAAIKNHEIRQALFFIATLLFFILSIINFLKHRHTHAQWLFAFFAAYLCWIVGSSGYHIKYVSLLSTPVIYLAGLPLSIAFLIQFCRTLTHTAFTPKLERLLIAKSVLFVIFTLVSIMNFLFYGYIKLLAIPLLVAFLFTVIALIRAKRPNSRRFLLALLLFTLGYITDTAINLKAFTDPSNLYYVSLMCSLLSSLLFLLFSWTESKLMTHAASAPAYELIEHPHIHAFERYTSTAIDLDKVSGKTDEKPARRISSQEQFRTDLDRIWLSHLASKSPLSILAINIDHFSLFNDTFGRKKGDEVIKSLIDILHHMKRDDDDVIAQLSGDITGLLLPNTSVAVAKTLAETTVNQFWNQHYEHVNVAGRLTLSIGIASIIPTTAKAWELVDMSLHALDVQKHQGGNGANIYNPQSDQHHS